MARHHTYSKRSRESRKALTVDDRFGHRDWGSDVLDDHLGWPTQHDGTDCLRTDRRSKRR